MGSTALGNAYAGAADQRRGRSPLRRRDKIHMLSTGQRAHMARFPAQDTYPTELARAELALHPAGA